MVLSPAAEWRGDRAGVRRRRLSVRQLRGLPGRDPAGLRVPAPRRCSAGRGPRFHHFHHAGFFSSLFGAVVHYLVTFVALYAMAVIIDGLAPSFSAAKNQQNALKLAVYSMTPVWLAGVFALDPGPRLPASARPHLQRLRLLARPAGPDEGPPDRTGPYALAAIVCGDHPVDRRRGDRRADGL